MSQKPKLKILLAFGTRPEAIKMAPLAIQLNKLTYQFETKICLTAQHREMLDQVMDFFGITADYDLNLMQPGQNLFELSSSILTKMKDVLEDFKPDYILVHGDTTTSMIAALAAFYAGVKVGHVEAGLRTFNKWAPFPEEMNRSLTGRLADIHFAPTVTAKRNLLNENINAKNIVVTGNTVIDALHLGLEIISKQQPASIDLLKGIIPEGKDVILVTGHRRENHGQGFLDICCALKHIAEEENVEIVYPVHLNPNVQKPVFELLSNIPNVHLIPPQPYETFIWLMNRSKIIISDSGGIQEEAPSLGKPVIVMRDTTERPEAVEAGTVILVGTSKEKILKETKRLLHDKGFYDRMTSIHNPYGNGDASNKIIEFFKNVTV